MNKEGRRTGAVARTRGGMSGNNSAKQGMHDSEQQGAKPSSKLVQLAY